MHLALWIIASFLAVAYLIGGSLKLIVSKDKLTTHSNAKWAEDFDARTVKAIGVLEILGAIGLVLPAALAIVPVLVPLAASGLAVIMVGAVFTRLRRREHRLMIADLVYFALLVFVAWGRFGPESFTG